jgi:hypothetical protein
MVDGCSNQDNSDLLVTEVIISENTTINEFKHAVIEAAKGATKLDIAFSNMTTSELDADLAIVKWDEYVRNTPLCAQHSNISSYYTTLNTH